jgi:phosphoribosylglycinamide formyltransferase 1
VNRPGRIAVLASGSGTILEALLAAGLPIVVVVADRRCRALEVAQAASVPAVLVERETFGPAFDRQDYTGRVVATLARHHVDLVAMAGFMTVLAPPMFDAYEGRVVNTHPSLLPAFPGGHAVRDALAFGVKVTGCTVHLATETVDHGPILAQEAVPVLADDTESTLHERIKTVERRLYPHALKELLS